MRSPAPPARRQGHGKVVSPALKEVSWLPRGGNFPRDSRVIPAKAGIQGRVAGWTPAFAGVTEWTDVRLCPWP
jgi:hypothetical protein